METPDGRLVETSAERSRRRRRQRRATWVAVIAAFAGLVLAVWAQVGVREQVQENRRDADQTALTQLTTCQTANRTRPQVQINAMAGIDAALRGFGVSIEGRRAAAAAQVDALRPELARGRSIGFRDCNGDGRIGRADFLAAQAPPDGWEVGIPELLGADGLPHIKETP